MGLVVGTGEALLMKLCSEYTIFLKLFLCVIIPVQVDFEPIFNCGACLRNELIFICTRETEELPNANEKVASPEKQPGEEEDSGANKENTENETEEKEPEDKVKYIYSILFFY